MYPMENFFNATSSRRNEISDDNKSSALIKAIVDVENFFLHKKKGQLYKFLLNIVERPMIENVLYKTEGNQLKTAKILGINRNTLHAKIQKLKINVKDFKYSSRFKDQSRKAGYL